MATLALAYIGASFVSAALMSTMLNKVIQNQNRPRGPAAATVAFGSPQVNYHGIEKAIKERNLFNSTGEFPEEKGAGATEQKKTSTFDINAPCAKPTINAQLVGTIYLAGPDSVATLQEQGYSESDTYREGDQIVGNERASVVRIERNRVVLNNNGIKECLELAAEAKPRDQGQGFPDASAPPSSGSPGPVVRPQPEGGGGGGVVTLDEKYVQDELGPGFGTIIQKARLVPNTNPDNQMNGFKIFAIDQGSLLGKIGLQNGDIITQVNDTSLKQPEQGFAFYQSLQDEKEVRIQILRGGTNPQTITVRVK